MEENFEDLVDSDEVVWLKGSNAKEFWQSKTFWLNVVLTIMGIANLLSDPEMIVGSVFVIVAGVCGILLRVWFTTQPINH